MVQAGAEVVEAPLSCTSRKRDPAGRPVQGWVFHVFYLDGCLVEVLEAAKPNNPGIPDPAPSFAGSGVDVALQPAT